MSITTLDFETYYDDGFSLKKKLTIPEYVRDPRFHVHGLAIRPDGRPEFRADVENALRELQARFGQDLANTTVVCHNAYFDLYVLNHKYGIRPRHFIDTMLLAYHVHGRRDYGNGQAATLSALAERYGLEAKGDLEFMCGVRHPDARQMTELADYAKRDVEITAQLAERLLPQIARPDVELPLLIHTVRLFTQGGVCTNVDRIAELGCRVRQETAALLGAANVTEEQVSRDKAFHGLLEEALAADSRQLPMKRRTNGQIPATAKGDPEMQALVQDANPRVRALAAARLAKKGQDQKLARLDTMRRIAQATDGQIPPYLVYYGGHTGRFAGGGGFNIQNMGRSGIGVEMRQLFVPRPDHVFIIADFAQIEARVTAWFAGELGMLEAYREGRDLYSEFASQTFGEPVRKPRQDDPVDVQERLSTLRQVGKQAVLGLGFGMGAKRFMESLRADEKVAELFSSGQLDAQVCRRIVDQFRETYSAIPCFWKRLDYALQVAVAGHPYATDGLDFETRGETTLVQLPSGRALRYPRMRLDDTPRPITFLDEVGQECTMTPEGPSIVYGEKTALYGGKLCENVVQATARDILAEAILRLEAQGLPVLFHVHDEVIVEMQENQAEDALSRVEVEMSRCPEWAGGLPISCEATIARKYGK